MESMAMWSRMAGMVVLLVLAGSAGAAVIESEPIAGVVPAVSDGVEGRTGVFVGEWQPPGEGITSKLVGLLARRGGAGGLMAHTRIALLAKTRGEDRRMAEMMMAQRAGRFRRGMSRPEALATNPSDALPEDPWLHCYVPASYKPGELYGLVVWISASSRVEMPAEYRKVCDERKLIWVAPAGIGNDKFPPWRAYMALEAVVQMRRRFTLDSQRTYVAGMSGGGRMASQVALRFPDVFNGGLPMCGADFYEDVPVQGGTAYMPGFWKQADRAVIARAKKESRLALFTGTRDFNREAVGLVFGAMQQAGFEHVNYIEVTNMEHQMPPGEWFDKGIAFVDSTLEKTDALIEQGKKAEEAGKLGEAYLAYARAAQRAEGEAWKTPVYKAAALYQLYCAGVEKGDVEFRGKFGALAEARTSLSDAYVKKPVGTKVP